MASGKEKNNAGGGLGGKISPSSVLVIKDGTTKLVNVKNQDAVTKILDLVPDVINKFSKGKQTPEEDKDVAVKVDVALKSQEEE